MKFRYKVFLIGDPCCWLTGPGIVLLEIHFLVDCAIVVRNKSEDLTPQAQTVSSQLYNLIWFDLVGLNPIFRRMISKVLEVSEVKNEGRGRVSKSREACH